MARCPGRGFPLRSRFVKIPLEEKTDGTRMLCALGILPYLVLGAPASILPF
jgi:hypothetical protein